MSDVNPNGEKCCQLLDVISMNTQEVMRFLVLKNALMNKQNSDTAINSSKKTLPFSTLEKVREKK